jgi:hypothetical protein
MLFGIQLTLMGGAPFGLVLGLFALLIAVSATVPPRLKS